MSCGPWASPPAMPSLKRLARVSSSGLQRPSAELSRCSSQSSRLIRGRRRLRTAPRSLPRSTLAAASSSGSSGRARPLPDQNGPWITASRLVRSRRSVALQPAREARAMIHWPSGARARGVARVARTGRSWAPRTRRQVARVSGSLGSKTSTPSQAAARSAPSSRVWSHARISEAAAWASPRGLAARRTVTSGGMSPAEPQQAVVFKAARSEAWAPGPSRGLASSQPAGSSRFSELATKRTKARSQRLGSTRPPRSSARIPAPGGTASVQPSALASSPPAGGSVRGRSMAGMVSV